MKTVNEPSNNYYNYIYKHPKFTGCVIDARGNRAYCLNGQYHREAGPAIEHDDGYKEYCLYDKEYSYEEWKHQTTLLKLKMIADDLELT